MMTTTYAEMKAAAAVAGGEEREHMLTPEMIDDAEPLVTDMSLAALRRAAARETDDAYLARIYATIRVKAQRQAFLRERRALARAAAEFLRNN